MVTPIPAPLFPHILFASLFFMLNQKPFSGAGACPITFYSLMYKGTSMCSQQMESKVKIILVKNILKSVQFYFS